MFKYSLLCHKPVKCKMIPIIKAFTLHFLNIFVLQSYNNNVKFVSDLVKMTEPIFHTVITNPEGSRQESQSKPPPDPGKPSLLQRPCMYLTW